MVATFDDDPWAVVGEAPDPWAVVTNQTIQPNIPVPQQSGGASDDPWDVVGQEPDPLAVTSQEPVQPLSGQAPRRGILANAPEALRSRMTPEGIAPGIVAKRPTWGEGIPNELPRSDKPEDTFLGAVASGIRSMPAMAAQMAGGALRAMEDNPFPQEAGVNLPEEAREGQEVYTAIQKRLFGPGIGAEIFKGAQKDIENLAPNVRPFSPAGIAYQGLLSLPFMAAAVTTSFLTGSPLAGAGVMGLAAGAQEYGQERAEGFDPATATVGSYITALSEAGGENLPLEAFMKPGGKFLPAMMKAAGLEGAQEALSQIIQSGYDKGILHPETTWGEFAGQVAQAGLTGAATGAFVSAVTHPFVSNRFGSGEVPEPEEVGVPQRSPVDILNESINKTGTPSPSGDVPPSPSTEGGEGASEREPSAPFGLKTKEGVRAARIVETLGDGKYVRLEFSDGTPPQIYHAEDLAADVVPLPQEPERGETLSEEDVMGVPPSESDGWDVVSVEPDTGAAMVSAEQSVPSARPATISVPSARPEPFGPGQWASGPRPPETPDVSPEPPILANPVPQEYPSRLDLDTASGLAHEQEVQAIEDLVSRDMAKKAQTARGTGTQVQSPVHPSQPLEPLRILPTSIEDSYLEQNYGTKLAKIGDRVVAGADLSVTPDEVWIRNVNTADGERRQGYATQLVDDIFNEFPDHRIITGAMTNQGRAFFKSKYDIDDQGYLTPKQERLPQAEQPQGDAPRAAPVKVTEPTQLSRNPGQLPEGDGTRTAPVKVTEPEHVEIARERVNTEPTEPQKEAGNYQKGHVKFQGLNISIENSRGSERTGTGPDGKPWSVTMPADYGYVKGTEGADGDHFDVYLGPKPDADKVFVIDQVDAKTRKFDEHKAMLGFDNATQASDTYIAGFSDGKGLDRIGGMRRMTVPEFKAYVARGDTKAPLTDLPLSRDRLAAKPTSPELSGKTGELTQPTQPSLSKPESLRLRILDAATDLTGGKMDTRVLLRDLRASLPDVPRKTLDAELKRMQADGVAPLYRLDNQIEQTTADHAAALHFGPESRHMLFLSSRDTAPELYRLRAKATPSEAAPPQPVSITDELATGPRTEQAKAAPLQSSGITGELPSAEKPEHGQFARREPFEPHRSNPFSPNEEIVNDILRAVEESPYSYHGLRIEDGREFKPGDEIPESRHWIDGEPQEEKVGGVSTIGLSGDLSKQKVTNALKAIGPYPGNNLVLVGSDYRFSGEDQNESILRNGRAVQSWKETPPATPEDAGTGKFARRSLTQPDETGNAPPFFSALQRAVDGIKQEKAPAFQWRSTIKNAQGIKKEELDWSGLDQWLEERKGQPTTKAEIKTFLDQNKVELREVEKGSKRPTVEQAKDFLRYELDGKDPEAEFGFANQDDYVGAAIERGLNADESGPLTTTKFSNYTLPGGKNYREMLLTIPDPSQKLEPEIRALGIKKPFYDISATDISRAGGSRDLQHRWMDAIGRQTFRSGHWDEPNVVSHIRFDDREGPNGERVLHVAEIQSDWHQIGRKKGYKEDETALRREINERRGPLSDEEVARVRQNRDAVPNAPFKTSWHELALKRVLRYAAENGYDRLSWDTGATNADRFDLSKQVDGIAWHEAKGELYILKKGEKDWGGDPEFKGVTEKNIADFIGKDVAERLGKQEVGQDGFRELTGENLKVGGEGMRGFYDKILPDFANKYVKKWGAKVETSNLPGPPYNLRPDEWSTASKAQYEAAVVKGAPIHSIPITPPMRESVMQGQPLFQVKPFRSLEAIDHDINGVYEEFLRRSPDDDSEAAFVRHQDLSERSAALTKERQEAVDALDERLARPRQTPLETILGDIRVEVSPELTAQRDAVAADLRKRLDAVNLHDVSVKVVDRFHSMTDGTALDANGYALGKVIAIALDSPDTSATLDHEVMHIIRDLLTDQEWATLEARAKSRWMKEHRIDELYPDLPDGERHEEAAAFAYSKWRSDARAAKSEPPSVRRVFQKILNALRAIARAFRSNGFNTPDEIFRKIERGEVGARARARTRAANAPRFQNRFPQTVEEAHADINDAIDDVAAEGGGSDARAAVVAASFPPEGPAPEKHLSTWKGMVERNWIFPRVLATVDELSSRYWAANERRDATANRLMHEAAEGSKLYVDLKPSQKATLHGLEELGRLKGITLEDDGRRVVMQNDIGISRAAFLGLTASRMSDVLQGSGMTKADADAATSRIKTGDKATADLAFRRLNPPMAHSKFGDILAADRETTAAYFERRKLFSQRWRDLMSGFAAKQGWTGPPDPATIRAAAEASADADKAGSKRLFRLAGAIDAMQEHERAGYVHFSRNGDYYLNVVPKSGTDKESLGGFPRTFDFRLVESKASLWERWQSNKRAGAVPSAAIAEMKKLRALYPEELFDIKTGYLVKNQDALRSLDIPAIDKFLTVLGQKDADKFSALAEELQTKLYDDLVAGFKKRASNIPGYSSDFERVTGTYFHWTSNHIADQIHGNEIDAAKKTYIDNHPDPGTKAFWTKWNEDKKSPQNIIRGLQQLGFMWELAGNISSAIVTLFDVPMVVMPTLGIGLGPAKVGLGMVAPRFGAAYLQVLRAIPASTNKRTGIDVKIENMKGISAEERTGLLRAEKEGLFHSAMSGELMGLLADQKPLGGMSRTSWERSKQIAASGFSVMDRGTRIATWLTAHRLAKQPGVTESWMKTWGENQVFRRMVVENKGKLSPEIAARFMVEEAAGVYGKHNRPELTRGPWGSLMFQFKGYSMRYISALTRNMFRMGPEGKYAAMSMLASVVLYAGVRGLPLVGDAGNALWAVLGDFFRTDPNAETTLAEFMENNGVSKNAAEMILSGPSRYVLGINLSSRLGFSNLIGQTLDFSNNPAQIFGVVPGIIVGSAYNAAMRLQHEQPLGAVGEVLPAVLKNPYQAFVVYPNEGLQTKYTNPWQPKLVEPEDFTTADLIKKSLGFEPAIVARARDTSNFFRELRDAARTEAEPHPTRTNIRPPEMNLPRSMRGRESPFIRPGE